MSSMSSGKMPPNVEVVYSPSGYRWIYDPYAHPARRWTCTGFRTYSPTELQPYAELSEDEHELEPEGEGFGGGLEP
jgi:hypothetical protein